MLRLEHGSLVALRVLPLGFLAAGGEGQLELGPLPGGLAFHRGPLLRGLVLHGRSQRGRLTADMRISGLAQWSEAQAALAGVSQVTGITLVAMDTGTVRMQINYVGTADQLREALGAARLSLTSQGGQWLLASAS